MPGRDRITGRPHVPAGWDVIVRHYEECLATFGVVPCGVDWPNGSDLAVRLGVMLEMLAECPRRPSVLDVGCGPGLMLDYLAAVGGVERVQYHGIDLSGAM